MSINQSKLLSLLPGYDGQDAATVAAALSAKILTPRTTFVTWATLNSAAVWGVAKTAAFRGWIGGKVSDPTIGGICQLVLDMLGGVGFDPSDAQAATIARQLVVSGAPLVQDDADIALHTISYACDDVVTADDVTAGRVILAAQAAAKTRADAFTAVRVRANQIRVAWENDVMNLAEANGADAPTIDSFKTYVAGITQ